MPARSITQFNSFLFRRKENPVFPVHPFARFAFQGTINLQLAVASVLDSPRLDLTSNFIIT